MHRLYYEVERGTRARTTTRASIRVSPAVAVAFGSRRVERTNERTAVYVCETPQSGRGTTCLCIAGNINIAVYAGFNCYRVGSLYIVPKMLNCFDEFRLSFRLVITYILDIRRVQCVAKVSFENYSSER